MYLFEGFRQINDIHSFQTRSSSSNFSVPQVRGIESETFYFQGINSWKSLPSDIKNIGSYYRETKHFLTNRALSRENSVFT